MPSVPEIEVKLKRRETCPFCGSKMVTAPDALQRSEVGSSPWIECVAKSIARTANLYAEHYVDGQRPIDEEISRALRNIVANIRSEMAKHSIEKLTCSEPAGGANQHNEERNKT